MEVEYVERRLDACNKPLGYVAMQKKFFLSDGSFSS